MGQGQRVLQVGAVAIVTMLAFQNCTKTKFDDLTDVASKLEPKQSDEELLVDILDEEVAEKPDEVVEDEVVDLPDPEVPSLPPAKPIPEPLKNELAKNPACKGLFTAVASDATFQPVYTFHGIADEVTIRNAGKVTLHGSAENALVDLADETLVHGVFNSVCVRSRSILVHGAIGGNGGDIALINPDAQKLGKLQTVHGVAGADIVISGFEVESIHGAGKSLHIFSGRVKMIHGDYDEVHLYEGAQVLSVHGRISKTVEH